MLNSPLFLLFALLLSACLALAPQPAVAQGLEGIELGTGRELLDMRWRDADTVVLLQRSQSKILVSTLSHADQRIVDLKIPRSLQRAGNPALFRHALAPLGNALAVIEYNANLVRASRVSIYRVGKTGLEEVSTYHIPDEFWPEAMCWDESGENLFLAARPYLQPNQSVSVGVFGMQSEKFMPLLQRSDLDLVREMAFLPGSGELAILCGSYLMQFPSEDLLLLLSPAGNKTNILHGKAGQGDLFLLDDGTLLMRNSHEGRERDWVLQRGSESMYELSGSGLPAWDCQSSRDGSCLAGMQNPSGKVSLQVQTRDGSKAFSVAINCKIFRLNANADRLCAAVSDSQELYFVDLSDLAGSDDQAP
jgi:hypothetical protein